MGRYANAWRPHSTVCRVGALAPRTTIYGETLAVIGSIRPEERFGFELEDPVLEHKIGHGYDIQVLPAID